MNMDDKISEATNELRFGQYVGKVKYWFVILSSFGIVGVCCSIRNYDAFKSLQSDSFYAEVMFWGTDTSTRIVGSLFVFFFSHYINEYVWMGIYSIIGLLGTLLIFILTFTDKANSISWAVSAAGILLGVAVGGMWIITALTIFDDSGSVQFSMKWGLVVLVNMIGMLVGG